MDKKVKMAIRHAWNAGLGLGDAVERVKDRLDFHDVEAVNQEWEEMRKLFGCASAPMAYIHCWDGLPRPEVRDPAYDRWKGISGPGKQLREIIKEANNG